MRMWRWLAVALLCGALGMSAGCPKREGTKVKGDASKSGAPASTGGAKSK